MKNVPCLWHPSPSRSQNVYVAFQSPVVLKEAEDVHLNVFGSSLYRVYWNGEEIAEGPARFSPDHPEYDAHVLNLPAGRHVLSVIVHDYGVHTRILLGGIHPFLQCEAVGRNGPIPLAWKCKELTAFEPIDRRVNGQLGWMESCDTRQLPDLRQAFDGEGWADAHEIASPLGNAAYRPKTVGDCLRLPVAASEIARGTYADRFGYVNDDPPVRFISRALQPQLPADGVWVRYDLGKIGLYRPRIAIDAPPGTVVESGYAESLTDGRVFPVIPLSASTSCHVDRWISKGGPQQMQTFAPRGFRFLEVHIAAAPSAVVSLQAEGVLRTRYGESAGTFQCSDSLLNDIWRMGVETLRACSEDALVDTPTRERGQWIGDAAVIGMELLGVSFGDLELIRRGLQQASYRRRKDGLAAGLCPGQEAYLTTYALYWIDGCFRYSRLTGDGSLLDECYETAERTIDYFFANLKLRGTLPTSGTWDFIDWGHSVAPGDINVSLNLTLLRTLEQMAAWEQASGQPEKAEKRRAQYDTIRRIVAEHYITQDGLLAKSVPVEGASSTEARKAGYHATVLGLLYGLFDDETKPRAVAFIKNHMMDCFPNNPEANRLAHPLANHDRLITPSFSHFSLQALWEAGEADFVLEQYRTCWGWMREQGVTTLLEVFDTRWSHCHAWSGSPTWQLSRYALGLIPEPGEDLYRYRLRFQPGTLDSAYGSVPLLAEKGMVHIEWKRTSSGEWEYALRTDRPIRVSFEGERPITRMVLDDKEIAPDTRFEVQRQLVLEFGELH
ncbi:family 78 glycoside hydrolase catalytic domain [Cohnella soli]|uniref:Family 78 glycoside hydrolase catalytic domain n=1 Tax=Cohnella soli TaxID=425005 RepID=A0ABW0I187_9BACL